MIVAVESYNGDILLSGKVQSIEQLKYWVHQVLKDVEQRDFVPIFCARYHFDVLLYENQEMDSIAIDYFVDLDTVHVESGK